MDRQRPNSRSTPFGRVVRYESNSSSNAKIDRLSTLPSSFVASFDRTLEGGGSHASPPTHSLVSGDSSLWIVGSAVGGEEGGGIIPAMYATFPPTPHSHGLVSDGLTCRMRPSPYAFPDDPMPSEVRTASPTTTRPPSRCGCVPRSNPAKNNSSSVTKRGTTFIGGTMKEYHALFLDIPPCSSLPRCRRLRRRPPSAPSMP